MADNISTIGSDGGDDYSTPQAWENATDNDLVAALDREFGLLRGEAHGPVGFSGGTYNASFYRWLSTIDATHNFDHTDLTGARIVSTNAGGCIDNNNNFLRCGGTEGTSAGAIGLKVNAASGGTMASYHGDGTNCKLDQVVFYDSANTSDRIRAVQVSGTNDAVLNNCLIFNITAGGTDFAEGVFSTTAGNTVCNNCTLYDIDGAGASNDNGFDNCETNGCYAGGVDNPYAGTTSGDWNAADDTSSPGANSIDDKAGGDQFVSVTVSSEDFHIKSGAALIDASQDTANEADLDNGDGITTRNDHGCLEFVSAGGSILPQMMEQEGG